MKRSMQYGWVIAFCALLMSITELRADGPTQVTSAKIWLDVQRHKPGSLFDTGAPVSFELRLRSDITGKATLKVQLIDYFGHAESQPSLMVEVEARKPKTVPLNLGKLNNGYYTLHLDAQVDDAQGVHAEGSGKATFGIVPFVHRTAAEVREGGYRFGLKLWMIGKASWRGNIDWDEREAVDGCCKLGLQWTRTLLQQEAHISTHDLLTDYPMNAIIKVERFPKEFYDEQRYGPMNEWEKKYGQNQWTLKTLPQKEPYQQWLRQEIQKLPADQNIFEIWNEAWDKMSPGDLATLSGWITEAILSERPNAIIGPNLMGQTSKYEYDAAYIKAGGMKNMKMVALHPYQSSEDRVWLRDYRHWLAQMTGRDIDIYVTEYGSHSTPEGPSKRSEEEQARRVVRQSLSLYAEGVKAFTPHVMGQTERNPRYHEDWFGFYRLNNEPKPVLIADATCARMIDSKRYVGDLWFGKGIGAMLFEKAGVYTLALWTRDEQQQIIFDPGVDQVTLVDMVGNERSMAVKDGKLPLTVGPDLTYMVGVNANLERQASTELRADRWPAPDEAKRNQRVAHRFKTPPVLDGKFDEWQQMTQLSMINPKVNGNDASGVSYLAWDKQNLYIGLDMRDDHIMNHQPLGKLYREDSMELFISTEPRSKDVGMGPNDHQFFAAPESGEGGPAFGEVADVNVGKLAQVKGARYFIGKSDKGWVAEIALPWSYLAGFVPNDGAKLALEIRVNDADPSHPRWKIDSEDGGYVYFNDPTRWSLLQLEN